MRQIPKRLNNDGPGSMIIREGLKPVAEMLAYTSSERDDTAAEFIDRWNAFEPGGEVERLRQTLGRMLRDCEAWQANPHGHSPTHYIEEARAALAQEPAHAKA